MKVAIVTPILYDETSPFNHLFKDIINGILNKGHKVSRLVAAENEEDTGYKLGIESDEIRYFPYFRKRAEKSNIIFRYAFDTLTAIRMALGLKKVADSDALLEDVCYSSFWTVAVAKKRGMRIVAMVQDIWPDNAVASGLIGKNSLIYKFFEFWQRPVYKMADEIICISADMKKYLVGKGVCEEKISVIYNWGYTDESVNIPTEENEFIKKFDLDPSKFYAVYAGNIGRMQNVELIVDAAKGLADYEKIEFLIIGDGVSREKIENKIAEDGVENIKMLPMQDNSLATHIYSAAGVNIIPLVKDGVETALPSKTGVVLSCGKETAFCFGENCSFGELLKDYSLNSTLPSDKPEALADFIKSVCENGDGTQEQCQKLFEEEFTRTKNIDKYVMVIEGNESIIH